MNKEAIIGITIALSLSILTLVVLLVGIVTTELENAGDIYRTVERCISLGSDIVSIVAIILAVVAYGQWKVQLTTSRTIESIEVARRAVAEIKNSYMDADVYIEEGNWIEKGRAAWGIEKLNRIISKFDEIYTNSELSHGRPLVSKELRKQLMTINSFSILQKIRLEQVVILLKNVAHDESTGLKTSLETASSLAKLDDIRREWEDRYSRDLDSLIRVDRKLYDLGLSL